MCLPNCYLKKLVFYGKVKNKMSEFRSELSVKNKYRIDRHRYLELKQFCMQYPLWKKVYDTMDGASVQPPMAVIVSKSYGHGDPTAQCAEARSFYSDRIDMIEKTAKDADPDLWKYLVVGITEGRSYDTLKKKMDIPCCKDVYYDSYRKFFWLLSCARA